MTISTQAMTAAGENFSYSKKAAPPSSFGPGKITKTEPFTDMEIAHLVALINKNLNEFFDPL